jgi:hypothetical protein
MVHRVYMNDPTLLELDFSNLSMPPPWEAPLIAPKLMKSIGGHEVALHALSFHKYLQTLRKTIEKSTKTCRKTL